MGRFKNIQKLTIRKAVLLEYSTLHERKEEQLEVFTVFRNYKLRLNHLEVAVKKLQSSYLAIIIFFRIISRLLD